MRSETVEVETGTHKTKVSDSGYSNSCSNSQSQRSSGSSKSRNSGSSRSSGYHGPSAHQQGETSSSSKEKESKRKTGSGGGGGTGAGTDAQNGSHQAQHKAQHQGNGQVGLSIPSPALPSHFTNGHQGGGGETGVENELLQAAAFTQTLTSLKRIKSIPQLNDLEKIGDTENRERGEENGVDGGKEEKMEVESAGDEDSWEMEELMKLVRGEKEPAKENELGLVVSMDDGMVIHTTKSIRKVLGFPKEMWLGRSLIDFIHPRHRASFANHITAILASNDTAVCRGRLYSCYLRRYRGLMSTGFTVTEKWVGYLPFQLAMSFKERQTASALDIYLVINAIPIKSAYDDESSNMQPQKFSTRHTASSYICHVDPEVTPYFGYLPQDIIGRSVFDFYHPEDLHFLKEVYEAVMKEQGHLFRSKPYRFRCQNGGFALIESELSSFINPWSRKLEFIICQHTVLRGPPDPDVITPVFEPESPQISEEVLKETKIVQEEIKCLLNETVVRNFETAKQQVSKRCKDLAAFMENLIDELTRPPNLKVDVHTEEHTFSERDSVMLGEISPHHEYYDSGTSSETPPSYTQLNYNENIQRFFESKPKTTMSDESLEPKVTPQGGSGGGGSGGEEGKTSPALETSSNSKSDGSRRGDTRESGSGGESGGNSGGSGSRGTGETSSGGNSIEVSREERRGGRPPAATLPQPLPEVVQPPPGPSGEGTSQEPADQPPVYKPPTLTELLLSRHNEDMEKQMVAKHREARSRSDSKSKERLKGMEKMQGEETGGCHGMKRSGSHSWEGEPHKSIKAEHHPHEGQQYLGAGQEEPLTLNREGAGGQTDFEQLLPPLPPPPLPSQPQQSVSALLSMSSRPIPSMDMNGWNGGGAGGLGTGFTSPLMPFYYMPPSGQGLRRTDHLSLYPHPHSLPHPHPHPHQVGGMGYMGSMVYQPVVLSPQPVMYSPVTVLPPAGPQHPAGGATLEFCQPPLPIPSQAPGHLMVKPNNRLLAPHPHHLSNTNPKIGCSGGRRLMGGGRELGCLPETRGFEMEGQASRFQPPSRSSDLKTATNENSIPSDDTGSSFSSLLKTDESLRSSSEIDTKQETELRDRRKKDWEVNNIRKEAPWTENVNINPELVLKYQLQERSIDEVLTKDLSTLNHVTQPELVTKQLSQMYLDLEAEGAKHDLFDESSSTSSDSQLSPTASHHSAKVKEDDEDKIFMEYDKMVIVFEEEAPLPPPMAQSCT